MDAGRRALNGALTQCGSEQTDLGAIVTTGYGRVALEEASQVVTEQIRFTSLNRITKYLKLPALRRMDNCITYYNQLDVAGGNC